MAKQSLSIIIPAYNEEEKIGEVIAHLKASNNVYEVLVVDDGSTDNTYNIVKNLGVKVIKHPYNKGYGSALKTGLKSANGDVVITMDGDGQHNPEDIPELIKYIGEYDMVVGARTKGSYFSLRKPGKKVLNFVANYLAGMKIPDLTSGFRAIKKDVAMKFLHIMPEKFSFSTTITLAVIRGGYNTKYIPIEARKRTGGKSTVVIWDGFRTLLFIVRIINLFSPLRIFLPACLVLFVVGGASFIYDVFHKNISDATLLLLISGILVFFFGLLADQMSHIRREMK